MWWIVGTAGRRWYQALPQINASAGGLLLVLVLVLGSVLVSRLIGVESGVLFAVLIGLQFGRTLRENEEGRLVLLGTGLSLALGVSAWIGYGLVSADTGEPTFWSLLWQDTLAAITVESIVALIVLMLPLAFPDGKALWNWSKRAWAAGYIAVLLVFAVVVMPMPEQWADSSNPPSPCSWWSARSRLPVWPCGAGSSCGRRHPLKTLRAGSWPARHASSGSGRPCTGRRDPLRYTWTAGG